MHLQAVGLPNTTLLTSNLVNNTNNFMPQGNLTQLIAGDITPSPVLAATSAPLPTQVNRQTHRYPFGTAGYEEVCIAVALLPAHDVDLPWSISKLGVATLASERILLLRT